MTEKKVKKEATKSTKPAAKKATGEAAVLEKIAAMPEPLSPHGRAPPRGHLAQRAGAPADRVVWRAGVREGRPDRLFLPRGQEIHNVRLHPGGEPDSRGGRTAPV
jgi:hypothetical protein